MGEPDCGRHHSRYWWRLASIDEPVILRVRANPEPHDAVTLFDPESAMAATDANGKS